MTNLIISGNSLEIRYDFFGVNSIHEQYRYEFLIFLPFFLFNSLIYTILQKCPNTFWFVTSSYELRFRRATCPRIRIDELYDFHVRSFLRNLMSQNSTLRLVKLNVSEQLIFRTLSFSFSSNKIGQWPT